MSTADAAVFGGAGFIGSHLLRHLSEQGTHQALYSIDIAEPRFRVPGVVYITHDVRSSVPPNLVPPGDLDIFNLAAVHTTPGHEDWEYYWTNVLGAVNVCEFAAIRGTRRIFFTSSIAVYGPSEEPKDEDSALEPVSAYGRSKFQAERIHVLWQQEDAESRQLIVARPAVIYGFTERGNFTRLAKLLAGRRFFYPGRSDTVKACGYVKDLVGSLLYVSDLRRGVAIYNFAQPQRTTSKDICEAFCSTAGYTRPSIVVPISLMMIAAWAFELIGKLGWRTDINRERVMKLMNSTNIVAKRLREWGYSYKFDLPASLADWKAESSSAGASDFT
ncbi:NAD(P)-dependent oxidoreductase [Bradyrhizobium manausense]|uniref:NAD-dependent epimerase/dehydratase family protein n=1 Tax=Bradyrhizobium manausense TaxID=989370 RepID=UPI001BAAF0EC|nr:NAD(P)-dependent oxidoreductase [Bradyrhizobium manausense]MBR1092289.1 NAD(P)-dependent oxidoreductase [Bradyrhizobium manausense]